MTCQSVSVFTGHSTFDFAGAVRCSKIMWSAKAAADAKASKKWIAVNRRTLHDVTVDALKIQLTISSPRTGTTLSRFKMTSAAQYDILPDTTTYPVKAVTSDNKNITLPTSHIKNFCADTTCENIMALPRWTSVAITTKFAQSICSRRNNHTRLPWKTIEIISAYCTSRE
jgi:uncharacterized lipoprotein NlpE involved in copper resistance